MSRTTTITRATRAAAYSAGLFVLGLNAYLLSKADFGLWWLAVGLAALALGAALAQDRLSALIKASVSEVPLVAALLLLDPGLAMTVGALVGLVPRGRLGNVSRSVNFVTNALPMAIAGLAFHGMTELLGVADPRSGPMLWCSAAVAAVVLDAATHFSLGALWTRLAYGLPVRDFFRDVVVPLMKNDPIAGFLVIPLVGTGLLLDGTARLLPVGMAIVGAIGIWMSLQTTRRQVETQELKDDFFRAIFASLARLLEMKDPDTAFHSARVAVFSREIAAVMGLSEEEQSRIHLAGLLHDVGKVGVPDHILLKPGRLLDEEREIMQRHARLSAEAIQGIPGFGDLVRTVYAHHERMDGSGYPEGISGDELTVGARILGVADTFEALTSDRPYRKGRTDQEALQIMDREIELFDREVVGALRYLILSGAAVSRFRNLTDFSDEWSKAAKHLEVRLDEEPFVLPPEKVGSAADLQMNSAEVEAAAGLRVS